MRNGLLLSMLVVLAGCSEPGGVMLANGKITRCPDWHTDNQACGNALFNSKVIGLVKLGQTEQEVRAIMGHDAERREGSLSPDGRKIETGLPEAGAPRELHRAVILDRTHERMQLRMIAPRLMAPDIRPEQTCRHIAREVHSLEFDVVALRCR